MSSVIPLHFRPTIVVCIGTAGKEIGEQLALLLPSLDPARRAGVALLAIEEDPFDAQGQIVGRWFDPDLTAVMEHQVQQSAFGGATTALPTSLPLLVVEALRGQDARTSPAKSAPRRGVLDDSTITRIQDDVSAVSKVSAVVWIAAAVESVFLDVVARHIRDAMESEHGEALVLLALANIPPHDPAAHRTHDDSVGGQPWEALLMDTNGEKALAAFAYLFDAQGEQRTYWAGRYDVPFAAAEAIFVMTATGVTITHEFEMSLRRSLPQMVKQPYERISSVGASRLTFPRAQAEQYCANQLGAQLVREWGPQESTETVDEQESNPNEAAQQAVRFMSDLNQQIRDSETKKRGSRPSPLLSATAMAQVQGKASNTSKPDGGLIFQHFSYSEFERFISAYQDLSEVLAQQNEKANQGFAQWQHAVRMRWEGYEHECEHELSMQASEMMLQGTAGIIAARTYMTELNHLIVREKERLTTRREDRELAYEHFLNGMEDRATGRWLATTNKPVNALYAPQTTQANGTNAQDHSWTAQLLEQLNVRYRWHRNRRPSIAAIIGAACGVVPAGTLLGQAILSQQWFAHNRLAIPLLAVVLTLIAALMGWGAILYQRRQEQQAAEDLRQLYRRIHAYQCESYEDLRRAALLTGLHHRVRRLLDRLLEWSTFMAGVAKVMEQDATTIEQDLFEGAMGRRDVLIANRHVLRQHDYNLRRFEQEVSTKRSNEAITRQAANGVEDWHRTVTAMLPYLRHHLQGVNLLEVTPDKLKHPVRDFALAVIRPHLSGDMVSIGAALEAMPASGSATLFDRLVRQGAILYKPATPAPHSSLFVAAREEFRQSIMKEDQATEAVLLHIDDEEWLGVLRLQPGGAIPTFWPAGWDTHSVPASPSWYQPAQKQDVS